MRHAPIAIIALLTLAGCGGGTSAVENEVLAAENAAGLDGDIVELPGGEGDGNAAPAEEPSAAAIATADGWVGQWRGVEGLNLDIARGDLPGHYRLTMQYTLDDSGSFDGTATEDGIAFTRPDGPQLLRATDGAATGLKYLDGKTDCLTVKDAEGYCRD
ncbi:hypothetical protein OKW76_11665 [Sphingomonas sp. S1-29]|uniref:hypothetical protein n=1 Tax=Sphingomonas sp. S1-29 TaxID=2991074 RepID=UPI002240934C|nr:hypothetical protein [Sphingomonas sp. S1-29]UZK68697.1 hypothetical protein OKW76_11665 [Sphingomonas sp. S1-29]